MPTRIETAWNFNAEKATFVGEYRSYEVDASTHITKGAVRRWWDNEPVQVTFRIIRGGQSNLFESRKRVNKAVRIALASKGGTR